MKHIYNILLVFALFLASAIQLSAQSDSCYNASPFCDNINQYPAVVSGPTAPAGNNYGCLGSQPNPTFFTLTVGSSGSIDITLLNTANIDIDYILWGPYADLATAQSFCGNLGNGTAADGNLVDTCSYSFLATEYVQVSNAVAGSVYILMITNFANAATNIYSTTNSGTGSIACPCYLDYTMDTLPSPINQGYLTDTATAFGQYVVCPGDQLGLQINVGGNSTDTLALYAPLTTMQTMFPSSTIFTQPGLNHDTISIGALWTPTQADVGTHTFDIAVQSTTPTHICQEVIEVEVIVPGINLRDTTICSGDSILIPIDTFQSTYVGFSQYTWTQIGGTTATLSNNNIAQPTITAPFLGAGVPFDSIVMEVQFSYGGCITIDTVTIIIIGIPDASFNYTNNIYCKQSTNPTPNLLGTPGGVYSSNTGVIFASTSTGEIDLTNTPAGIHNIFYELSSPGGQCDARDTFVLEIMGITQFDATADEYFICPNELDTIQLNLNVAYAGTVPSSPTYSWTPTGSLNNANIQNPIAILLTPDTFVVTYNDGICDAQTDTVAISAPYPISLTVSPDITICNGGSAQLGATVAAGGGSQTFSLPAPATLTAQDTTFLTLNVSGVAPGNINSTLIASLSVCFDINMNNLGSIAAYLVAPSGESVALTINNGGINSALINATFSAATGNNLITGLSLFLPPPVGGSFFPQAGALGFNSLLGATSNGTWTLMIIHAGGIGATNGTLNDWCLSFPDLSQATYVWEPNYNISCTACDSPTVSPTVDTTYMVVAQNAFGCIDTGLVNVTIDSALPAPIITCGQATQTSVIFNWNLIGGAAGYSVSINGAAPQVLPATQDSIEITGLTSLQCVDIVMFALSGSSCQDGAPDSLTCCAIGCTSIDPIIIGTNGPTTFCVGGSITLDAGAASSYLWSTTETSQTINVTSSQLVSVTTTDAFGCLDTGSVFINVTPGPAPTITASGSTTLCAGESVTLDAGAGFNSYTWSPSGNTQSINVTSTSTNVVTVTDSIGCEGYDTMVVTVGSPLTAPITGNNLSCNGSVPSNGSATATPAGGFGNYTYNWSAVGQNTITATGLAAGVYTLTVTDNNNCTVTNSVTITEPSAVSATATGNPVSCNGSSDGIARVFGAGGTVSGNYTFLWDAAAGNQVTDFAVGLLPGNYCVTVSDDNGCLAVTCTTVGQTTHTFSASGDTSICEGDSSQIFSTAADGYTWTPSTGLSATNVQNPMASPIATTTYYVTSDILSGVNIIFNGDFEAGNTGFGSSYTQGTGGAFGLLSNPGTFAVNTNASNTHNNFAPCTDHSSTTGNFMVVNGATVANTSVWCQTVNVTPGTDYQFSTWVTSVVASNPAILQFSINGVNISTPFTASATTCQWNQFFATWNSGANTTATICIVNQNTGGSGNDFGLDDIEFIPICHLVDSVVVTVNSKPTITISNSSPVCENNPVNLFSSGGTIYNWTGPNSFTSASQNPSIANAVSTNAGLYSVTVTSPLGCSDIASTNVVVNLPPSLSITNTSALCFGSSTGTATATPLGGGTPYSYLWNNGQNNQSAINLAQGNYQVTVTDNNGCTVSGNTTITEPTVLSTTASSTPITCNGGNDGVATATASGGTSPYTYLWCNGQTTNPATNLPVGTCSVTVTDINGCSAIANTTLTEPSAMSFTIASTDVSCNGGNDGTTSINVSGGVGGFTYLWNDGQTTATATGLTAGTHCVTATDGNGCTVDTCMTIIEPTALGNVSFTAINVQCFGDATGQLTVSLSGGIQPYSYLWANGQTGNVATNLDANVHSVTITDANGCSITDNGTVTQPTQLQISLNVDSVSCKGGNDGQITATTTGGTFPYTYLWDAATGNQNTAIATGLTTGTYSVTATDFNNCIIVSSAFVSEPLTPLTASIIAQSDPTCNGGSNGSIEVDAQGATPNYTYQWSNGQTSSLASGITAGAHTVTVTDANGCSISLGGVLTDPSPIALNPQILSNYNGAAISCAGGSDGSVGVTAAGGTGLTYTYLWSPLGQNTATINGLFAGTYCVTVSDVEGCQADTCIVLNDPVPLAATFTKVDILCNGDNNGQILVNATPGTGTLGVNGYEYKITGPGQTGNVYSSINSYSNLIVGTYDVFVRDGNGCNVQLSIQITEPDSVLIDSVVVVDALCFGTATGTATAYASGGVGNFSYAWSGTANGQTTQMATGLAIGLYNVTVSDANGCDRVQIFNVGEASPLVGSITAGTISCMGGVTTATASASGGTPINTNTYLYNWSNGITSATTIGLTAGIHCVTITDANACTTIECVTITEPSTGISAIISAQTDVLCQGGSSGTATAQGVGGTSPYTYLWNNNAQTTQTATGLMVGVYTVSVTDTNGCPATAMVTITEPTAVAAVVVNATSTSCNGQSDGSAMAIGSGGTPGYTYLWANGETTQTATGLAGGPQTVTLTDANGCTTTAVTNIIDPPAIQITALNTTDVLCKGDATGTANIAVQGGNPIGGYIYQWSSTSQGGAIVSGLSAGSHSVTVSDINGCSVVGTFTIGEPTDALTGYLTSADALCFGSATGELGAVIQGGTSATGSYNYLWNTTPVQSTVVADSLLAGTYTVTVTDDNLCSLVLTGSLGEASELSVTASVQQNVSCYGGSNGVAIANTATGGTPNYSYVWTDPTGQSTQVATNLMAGPVTVVVTDNNACTASATVTITEAAEITASANINHVSCNGGSDGSITISSSSVLVNYAWSAGIGNPLSGLAAGTYDLTVTDNFTCTETFSYTVTEPDVMAVTIAQTGDILCNGDNNGQAEVTTIGGTPNYSYNWTNGSNNSTASNLTPGTHMVTVMDSKGCSETVTISIAEPEALTITGTTTGTLCAGDETGSIAAFGSGGTTMGGLLQYSVDATNWQSGNIFSGLTPGIHILSVQDQNGCTVDTSLVIEDADPFFITSMTADTLIEYLDSMLVYAMVNDTVNISINWSIISGAGTVVDSVYSFAIAPDDPVDYLFTATNANGCVVDSILMVDVKKPRRANAPMAFTPNGDGVNDYFFIQGGAKVKTVTLFRVYDRWGELVFEGSDLDINASTQGWDGNFRGQQSASGAYIWYAEVEFKDGHKEILKGDILLVR